MMELVVLILSALAAVAWAEFREWLPWFARRLILWGVEALPIDERDRMREELLAEVAAVPGKISPFVFAFSLCWGFWRPVLTTKLEAASCHLIVRTADVALSSLLLLLLSPLLLCLGFLVRLSSGPGYVLSFKVGTIQNRTEAFGFRVFRTTDTDSLKVTNFGRFLQQTSLHKLPILFSVLGGTMSLVGPPSRFSCPALEEFPEIEPGLKPGLVWFTADSYADRSRFGRSTLATLWNYVALLWSGLCGLLKTNG